MRATWLLGADGRGTEERLLLELCNLNFIISFQGCNQAVHCDGPQRHHQSLGTMFISSTFFLSSNQALGISYWFANNLRAFKEHKKGEGGGHTCLHEVKLWWARGVQYTWPKSFWLRAVGENSCIGVRVGCWSICCRARWQLPLVLSRPPLRGGKEGNTLEYNITDYVASLQERREMVSIETTASVQVFGSINPCV